MCFLIRLLIKKLTLTRCYQSYGKLDSYICRVGAGYFCLLLKMSSFGFQFVNLSEFLTFYKKM